MAIKNTAAMLTPQPSFPRWNEPAAKYVRSVCMFAENGIADDTVVKAMNDPDCLWLIGYCIARCYGEGERVQSARADLQTDGSWYVPLRLWQFLRDVGDGIRSPDASGIDLKSAIDGSSGSSVKPAVLGFFSSVIESYDQDAIPAPAFRRLSAKNGIVLHTYDPEVAGTERIRRADDRCQGGVVRRRSPVAPGQFVCRDPHRDVVLGGAEAGRRYWRDLGRSVDSGELPRSRRHPNNQIMVGDDQESFGFVRNIAINQQVLVRNRQFDVRYPES
ncbi:hypothetical protein DL770_009988 [Monosporascus sp. CRB-9-2]|nr:hypothetical protein DL770_009988 [Monosporascus sp. CRB-9-2]